MIEVAATGIRTALLANGTLTALLSTTYAVYTTQAPATAVLPYVLLQHAAGGTVNTSPREAFDMRFNVKGLADSAAAASSIAAQIRVSLHNGTITLPGSWKALDCQELAVFEYAENVSGKQIWHIGAVYQLRATL